MNYNKFHNNKTIIYNRKAAKDARLTAVIARITTLALWKYIAFPRKQNPFRMRRIRSPAAN